MFFWPKRKQEYKNIRETATLEKKHIESLKNETKVKVELICPQ